MTQGFSLSKSFWRNFIHAYWNRKPTVIRAPFRNPIVTPTELFRSVVAARRRFREPTDDLTLQIGNRRIVEPRELDCLLPCKDDSSIEGYLARLQMDGDRRELAINITDFQLDLGWAFFHSLRQFLKGLYETVAAPPRAEVNLFLGNYRRTGAGLHRDSAEVCCFVVDGVKRMRLWSEKQIRSASPRSGPAPYDKYLEESILLEGNPGDIIYWPASYWHVAESDGALGASLSLSLYYGYSLFTAMAERIGAWSREIMCHPFDPVGALPFSNGRTSQELASVATRIEGKPGQLSQRLLRFWMDRTTGYGFGEIPPVHRSRRLPSTRLRPCPVSQILWRRFGSDLAISANGRSIVVSYDRKLAKWLSELVRGRECNAKVTPSEGRRKSHASLRTPLRKAVQFLLNERAVEYV